MAVREQKHRLDRNLYKGFVICAFTLCIKDRGSLFVSKDIFSSFEKILLDSLKKNNCDAHVYLFMPDHCHFILEGKSDESDLWKTIVAFKQKTGYWLSKNKEERWQKDFYDHIIRKDEDLIKQVRYILENPCRKNMVKYWKDYSFRGSTIYNLNDEEFEL